MKTLSLPYQFDSAGISRQQRIVLRHEITSPIGIGDECKFKGRCEYACEGCGDHAPQLVEVSPNHFVACPRYREI